MANYMVDELWDAYDKSTPETLVKPPPPRGYLQKVTRRSIRHAVRLKQTMIRRHWSDSEYEEIKARLKILNKGNTWMIKKDKITNEIRQLETSANKGKNFFWYMKSIQRKTSKIGPIRDLNDVLQTTDQDMANAFNDFLADQLQPGAPVIIDWSTIHPDSPEVPLTQVFITAEAVKKQIRNAKRSAAAGPDGLPMEIYSEACNLIDKPLAMLYNLINQTGVIPEAFKTARVCMLHKKKAKDSMINYRPLSMTNHIGKIYERLMNSALVKHLEDNKLLSSRQHGFHQQSGAFSNLIELWEHIMKVVD
jgi:hypothetical protein